MLKIEKRVDSETTVLRLIGRIQAQHLQEMKTQIDGSSFPTVLDLAEVTMVDLDSVRFLSACERDGVELLHCSPYIREWILRERQQGEKG